MLKYIVRRLLGAIPVLFGLSFVLFAFVHLLPGDPSRAQGWEGTRAPKTDA